MTRCHWASCTQPATVQAHGMDVRNRPVRWEFCHVHNTIHRQLEAEAAAPTPVPAEVKRQKVAELAEIGWDDGRIAEHLGCTRTHACAIRRSLGIGLGTPRPSRDGLVPHGTHAAFVRHKKAKEDPCVECVDGERAFQAERHLRRKAAA